MRVMADKHTVMQKRKSGHTICKVFKISILAHCFLSTFIPPLPAQSVFDSLYATRTFEVYFESGQADLDAEAQAILDTVASGFQILQGQKSVRITAHTDSVGRADYNEALAKRRANAVSVWLRQHGVPGDEIVSVQAFGERQPTNPNQTESGRRRNRRATVEVARVVPMTTLAGKITNQKTGVGVTATLTFRTKSRTDSIQTDTSGLYRVRLPKDSVVKIEAVAHHYFFESVVFKLYGSPELYKKYKISPNIALPPANPGEKMVLRDLFFVGDQAVLLKSSEPELPKILRFMQLNSDLNIEIAGHVNRPFPEAHHFPLKPGQTPAEYAMGLEPAWRISLSTERAKTVYQYLLRNGIPAERMTYKGYRNNEMLFPHANTTREMEQNRRVEIRVTK